ncbi:Beta-lactamase domain-containing protein [Mycena sanguinolenta]|uniref:Beta-lactamase domain-containing protein n=1 Tax=Mycena sanguinolenta TaxID=230812 RepID=A0A8H6YHG4_9AGAR|nr:Beta-lactamase domain-containing protein [Mycena sanguinolenta]
MLVPRSTLALLTLPVTLALASQVPLRYLRNEGKVINEELSSFIQSELQANNFTGLSLGIVLPSGEVEFAAWGIRTEQGDPVNSETVMNLASCSKAFLSASLGILMQDFADGENKTALPRNVEKFSWDTKMRDLLPDEWMTEDHWTTEKASLKDLLSHVTGFPAHDGSYSTYDSPQDIVARMRHLRAAYELRQLWEYTNQGPMLSRNIPGSSYRDFLEERISLPLRMSSSTLYPNRAFESRKFTQSWTPSRRRIPFWMPEHTADLLAGAGGVMSNVEDMVNWVKMLLNSGVDPQTNKTIIPRTTFDLATSAISVAVHKGSALTSIMGYGLGWIRLAYRGHELVQHSGGAPGVATIVDLYPSDGFGVVLLANTVGPLVTQKIARAIADRMLGLPTEAPRVETEMGPHVQLEPRIPVNPIPPNILAGFTGTYSNLGYGNFTLYESIRRPESTLVPWTSTALGRGSGDHISGFLKYPDMPIVATLSTLYVDGYGADRTPFEDLLDEIYTAKFMVEDGAVIGLGFFIARQESWRAKKGGSVREIADVWFDKL